MMSKFGRDFILILFLLAVIGCSGPASSPLVNTTPEAAPELPPINWSEYEDFDPDKYREQPDTVKRFHDVPDELLLADAGLLAPVRERDGFRVHILTTLNKQEADQAVEDALVWWQAFAESSSFSEAYVQTETEPPIYQDFRAPNFRVRIGNFLREKDAKRFLEVIKHDYDSAFVAPSTVRVR